MLIAEEQLAYDSFRDPFWISAKSPDYNFQAQPVASTPAKPSGTQRQALAQAQTQAAAQAQQQPPAQAQPPRLAPAYLATGRPPQGLDAYLQTLYMRMTGSLWIFQASPLRVATPSCGLL